MSGDLAVLERLKAEWSRGEFWDAEAYAEDVVFVVSGPDAAEYHGVGELTAAWRDFLSAWEAFRIEPGRIVAGSEGVYVVLQRLQGRGKTSGLRIDAEVAALVHMQHGRIDRLEMFWDREAALRAAGVDEATENGPAALDRHIDGRERPVEM
jgi:ketosteroid isomerase-like protein